MEYKKIAVGLILCASAILTACSSSSSSSTVASGAASANSAPSSSSTSASISAVSSAVAEEVESREGDFRAGFWGDTMETIKQYETATLSEEGEHSLSYSTTVAGFDAYASYLFEDNKLYGGMYMLLVSHPAAGSYINDYNNLKESLKVVYGEPELDKIIPLSSSADYLEDDLALELGYSQYLTGWTTDTTEITSAMYSEDGQGINIFISYRDINYESEPNTEGL